MRRKFDVLIVGAGPAGMATALCLANSYLSVAVLDKAIFPREKICGDGLTLDVINQLSTISIALGESFKSLAGIQSCCGAEIFSPGFQQVSLPVKPAAEKKQMYTCRRIDFDNFLFQHLKQHSNITIYESCIPEKIRNTPGCVEIETRLGTFEGRILVGADGVNSFVARQMRLKHITPGHQCVAVRTYFRGLKPLHEGNPIEMYLPKEILPGYLWIFHLADGTSNVGIGILATVIRKEKIRLKRIFAEMLLQEPLKSRLAGAEQIEPVKGLIIPLGGERREISGNRFLLAGDAAALVDPITGEGVANAIRSERIAAAHILAGSKSCEFSAASNKAYDDEIYRRMLPEFRLHIMLRELLNYPALINYIMGSAANHPEIEHALQEIMWNLDGTTARKKLLIVLKIFHLFTLKNLWISVLKRRRKRAGSG